MTCLCKHYSESLLFDVHRVQKWLSFMLMLYLLSFRMMWAAGAVAAMSSITFPAVSTLVSRSADPDKQGKLLYANFQDFNCSKLEDWRKTTFVFKTTNELCTMRAGTCIQKVHIFISCWLLNENLRHLRRFSICVCCITSGLVLGMITGIRGLCNGLVRRCTASFSSSLMWSWAGSPPSSPTTPSHYRPPQRYRYQSVCYTGTIWNWFSESVQNIDSVIHLHHDSKALHAQQF